MDISKDLTAFAYNYGTSAHDDAIKIIDKFCTLDEKELDELAKANIPSYYDIDDEWIEPFIYGFKKGYTIQHQKNGNTKTNEVSS